jgi:hypothetical protein
MIQSAASAPQVAARVLGDDAQFQGLAAGDIDRLRRRGRINVGNAPRNPPPPPFPLRASMVAHSPGQWYDDGIVSRGLP